MKSFSLKVRLGLYYAAVLGLMLGLSGFFILGYLTIQLKSNFDQQLRLDAEEVERYVRFNPNTGPTIDFLSATPSVQYQLKAITRYVLITTIEGRPLYRSEDLALISLEVPAAEIREVYRTPEDFLEVALPSAERLRFFQRVFFDSRKNPYLLHLGARMTPLERSLRDLRWIGLVVLPLIYIVTLLGGFYVAHQALVPVRRVTETARRITSENLSERIPVPDARDEIGELAVTFNDMISRLETQFEQMRQFNSDVSHELRTPLTIMQGENEVALRSNLSVDEYRSLIASNLEELQRLTRMVNEMLWLSKVESGEYRFEKTPLALDALLKQLHDQALPLCQSKNIDLKLEAAEPALVMADEPRLQQLFLNLLSNAIKFTPPKGSICIQLKTQGQVARVTVYDTGIGISTQDLGKIFNRFYQAESSRHHDGGGVGLGLSIAQRIARAHGGAIHVESALGKGSTFYVDLPVTA
ncbi:MAG TPA: ATP-binding protein [Acidobacteriota bacterium]|jgi:heavy metal sensor kinase|nr:ATP-binding protein [Acidobacteriota bacterium]